MLSRQPIGEIGDAEPRYSSRDQRGAVVGLEASLRPYRDDLVAVQELPGFDTLHECLVGDELFGCCRRPMRFDVVGACDELSIDRADAPCDQVGVLEIAHPYRAIVALPDEIDEAVAVGSLDMQLGVASRHFGERGGEVSRPESKRRGNSQAASKVTGRQDRFPRDVDLRADPGGIVPERGAGFSESSSAGGPGEQLNAEFCFKANQPATDDRLGHAEPNCRGRNTSCIGDLDECLQLLDVHLGVPLFATQLALGWYYRIDCGNNRLRLPSNGAAGAGCPEEPNSMPTKDVSMTFRNGLASLLRPEDSVLVLIDHQPYQLANLNSHEPQMVVNNAAGLAKAAKAFDVPTILTSVVAGRGGLLFPQITEVFPGQEVIDRTLINTWEDKKVVDAVKATGRKQLIIAGLWTEVCVAMPVIQALGEGWDVTVVTDASGAVSVEAHEVAIQRMIAAGANMMTWLAVAAEWQRDWARAETAAKLTEVIKQHAGGSGIAYLWEQQLLNTPVPATAG